jgi:hypothetical protein
MVEVVPVKTDKDLTEFINFPYTLYKNDRYWVPPLKRDVRKLLDPAQNPFWKHGEREFYLAYRGKNIAGRICAIVDYNYIEFWNEKAGYFGFFECDRDEEAANALFEKVREFHRDKGMTSFIGPMNPSTNDECGVLVEGFFTPPMIMMTHNFEYYDALCRGAGLEKAKDLIAYYFDIKDTPWDRLERLSSVIRRRVPDMKVRHLRLDNFKNEVRKVKEVYNEAWSRNWGFVPMTEEEMDSLAATLKPLVRPELVTIIEIDEIPVAVALAVPNYNAVLKKLKGRIGPIEMLKFMYHKNKIDEARLLILGVRKDYRKMGLDALLVLESFRAGQDLRYKGGELSWILEDNYATNNLIIKLGGNPYKKYRIYRGML